MRVASDLASYAYAHSRAMAAKQTIFHSTDAQLNSIPNWIGLGENVGMGDTVDDLNQAFMHSPEHRFNILYHGFNLVGIGVVDQGGVIYVTEIFVIRRSTRHLARVHSSMHQPMQRHAAAKAQPQPSPVSVQMLLRILALTDPLAPVEPRLQTNPRPSLPARGDGDRRPWELAVSPERPKAVAGIRRRLPPPT